MVFKLKVKVVSAKDLIKGDITGSSDPYVVLREQSQDKKQAKKTKVIDKTLNPEWNEEFELELKDPNTAVIELQVFDYDKLKSPDNLGTASINLSYLELVQGVPKDVSVPLVGVSSGTLNLTFTALDFGIKQEEKKEEKKEKTESK